MENYKNNFRKVPAEDVFCDYEIVSRIRHDGKLAIVLKDKKSSEYYLWNNGSKIYEAKEKINLIKINNYSDESVRNFADRVEKNLRPGEFGRLLGYRNDISDIVNN